MNNVLVTGASSFLGYHVAKRLNEQGIRPRVLELRESNLDPLNKLDVSRCEGHLEDPQALGAACADVDTVLHLAFKVSVGGGTKQLEEMREVNIGGTTVCWTRRPRRAWRASWSQAVRSRSESIVGPSRSTRPPTGPNTPSIFPTRRCAGRRNRRRSPRQGPGSPLSRSVRHLRWDPTIPSAPLRTSCSRRSSAASCALRCRWGLAVWMSGTLRTARYWPLSAGIPDSGICSAVTTSWRASCSNRRRLSLAFVPRDSIRRGCSSTPSWARSRSSASSGENHAPVTRDVLQIIGRYAWYDTSRARAELGWEPRPLQQTLEDTIRWLRDSCSA